jgi:hypothetical protein
MDSLSLSILAAVLCMVSGRWSLVAAGLPPSACGCRFFTSALAEIPDGPPIEPLCTRNPQRQQISVGPHPLLTPQSNLKETSVSARPIDSIHYHELLCDPETNSFDRPTDEKARERGYLLYCTSTTDRIYLHQSERNCITKLPNLSSIDLFYFGI